MSCWLAYNQLSLNVLLFSCNPIGQLCLSGPGYSSRTVIGTGEKIGQQLTGASSVTIPETIAGHISAPVPSRIYKSGEWSHLTFN